MTKGIEDFLDIAPTDAKNKEDKEVKEVETTNPAAVPAVIHDQHDIEAEDIRKKAVDAFNDVMELGKNVEPSKSARMFEVAGQFLKTGLDAANAKADKQLKAAKLKLEARRLRIDDETFDKISHGAEIIADRNSLLKQLTTESEENTIDVEPEEEK